MINLSTNDILSLIEHKLEQLLPVSSNTLLMEAMRYSTLGGGKRIRPLLTLAGGSLSNASLDNLISIGAAMELIHCYSLIHDDLPAMDDDDLRRGRPTCHKQYNEAIAILAGDALQTEAFAVISSEQLQISAVAKLKIIQMLAHCSGVNGMVGGQALDLISTGITLELDQLQHMHMQKTGALIKASILCGYLAGEEYSDKIYTQLNKVSDNLGLLFQITDDILDVTADTQTLGKTALKDLAANKATYVNILGLERARAMSAGLFQETLAILELLPQSGQLVELTHFVYQRSS